jgi:hypothetical protein
LMPERDVGATPVICETGKLRYFDVPCSRNSRPTMMRKILRTRGDHVARKLSIAGIIIPPVDALRSSILSGITAYRTSTFRALRTARWANTGDTTLTG